MTHISSHRWGVGVSMSSVKRMVVVVVVGALFDCTGPPCGPSRVGRGAGPAVLPICELRRQPQVGVIWPARFVSRPLTARQAVQAPVHSEVSTGAENQLVSLGRGRRRRPVENVRRSRTRFTVRSHPLYSHPFCSPLTPAFSVRSPLVAMYSYP